MGKRFEIRNLDEKCDSSFTPLENEITHVFIFVSLDRG